MVPPRIRQYLDRLAERYGLRELGRGYEYLGLHRGVVLHVVEYRGEVALLFHSPRAGLGEAALEGFQGFRHCARAGIAPTWFRDRPGDPDSCLLPVLPARLQELGLEKALEAPELVARDLH